MDMLRRLINHRVIIIIIIIIIIRNGQNIRREEQVQDITRETHQTVSVTI